MLFYCNILTHESPTTISFICIAIEIKQVDGVLLLNIRRHAALHGLFTNAKILTTLYYNVLNFEFLVLCTQSCEWFINNVFCNSWNMLLCAVKEAHLKQPLCTTHYVQKYLLNCFIVRLSHNSLKNPPGCCSFMF